MKKNILAKVLSQLAICLMFFYGASTVKAQTSSNNQTEKGKIAGKIIAAETGEPIIGANILLVDTGRGAATDINGNYSIGNLSEGRYDIRVSYISYASKTITDIEVAAGEATTVNTFLQPKTNQLQQLVVTAQANRSSAAGLLAMQRNSVPIQDGISVEQISKLGDSDVGEALKRVTGVSVRNGNKVFVRGLGNRYSNVQLNGSQLPSTNANKKEAPIDLFGSGLLSYIVVQKTYTVDQSAEFSGGSVQITTSEFPNDLNFSISYSTSYNTVSTLENTLTSPGSSTDFLGYDSGFRNLPSVLEDRRVTDEIVPRVVRGLHNGWAINGDRAAVPSQSIDINYANQFNEDKMPVGVVAAFSYKYGRKYQPDKVQRSIQSFNETGPNFYTNYDVNKGIEAADLSGMMNLFLKPSSVTKIGFKNLYSNSTSIGRSIIQGRYQNGVNRLSVLGFDRRTIISSTLEAETYFENYMSSFLSGHISYNRAVRVRPDRRSTRYNLVGDEYFFQDSGDSNGHFFSDLKDNNYAGELEYEFNPADYVAISVGGNVTVKDRTFTARRLSYRDYVEPYVTSSGIASLPPGRLFDDENVINGALELIETTQFGRNQSDLYDGFQTIYAGFIGSKWAVSDNLSFQAGLRIEESTQTIEVPLSLGGEYVEVSRVATTDLLPAVNITYSLSDKTNLRAAFSHTLARPEFREISNFNFADFFGGKRIHGNPDLKRTRITNYDLRFEIYPNGGELFAVGLFYKYFENPIELFYRLTENNEVFYDNALEANLFGVEVEARKYITDRLQLVANAAYIYSQSHMSEEDEFRVANTERPMVGQSPYVINFSSFYTIPSWNMSLSLSYNTFGERIITVGKNAQQFDEYQQPFHSLGAKIDYRLGRIGVSLEAENLLNDERKFTQGPVTTFLYKPGRTFKLSFSLSL